MLVLVGIEDIRGVRSCRDDMAPRKSKKRATLPDPGPTQTVHAPPLPPPPYRGADAPALALQLAPHPLYAQGVHLVRNFLTAGEAAAWARWAEAHAGLVDAAHPASRDIAQRSCGRAERWDPAAAARLFARLAPLLPPADRARAIGCYEKLRLYRYRAGGKDLFGRHVDEAADVEGGGRTGATVLVYLTEVEGGETVFYRGAAGRSEATRFRPEAGALLWHHHGARCLEHEALPVTKGVKYVLRTDIVYAPR